MEPRCRGAAAWVIAGVIVGGLAACLPVETRFCDNGRICPRGTACIASTCVLVTCGDGVATGDEQCDGLDLRGESCTSRGLYEAGEGLVCGADCRLDTSGCGGRCGDGVINGSEVCDGTLPTGHCIGLGLGYDVGSPGCSRQCGPDVRTCGRIGWRRQLGEAVDRLWSDGQSLVAINSEEVRLFDGSLWDTISEVTVSYPRAIWGTSGTNVWVGTLFGGVSRWDGDMWHTAIPDDSDRRVSALWGTGPDNIYVLSLNGLARFDGAVATDVELPAAEIHGELRDVWGSSRHDVYVVGERTILHGEGDTWRTPGIELAGGAGWHSVWGSGPGDVYVVADDQVIHFDGSSWSPRSPPRSAAQSFTGISGSAANDVYLVAGCGFDPPPGCSNDVWRYDGARWGLLRSTSDTLRSVWVDSPSRIWVGGGNGVDQFAGVGYIDLGASVAAPHADAVWGTGPRDYFVAVQGTSESTLYRVVDDRWEVSRRVPGQVRSLVGFAADDVYAVATSGLLHFDGAAWKPVKLEWVFALWGRASDDVYACGQTPEGEYMLWHGHGDTWSSTPRVSGCTGGWSSGPDDVYVLDGPVLDHWNGTTWTPIRFGDGELPRLVWGWARDDVYVAVGQRIHHFDGTAWIRTTRLYTAFDQVAAVGRDDVFLASAEGKLAHFDGQRWAPMTAVPYRVHALWGTPSRLFVAGAEGVKALVRIARWSCREHEADCHDGVDDNCNGRIDAMDDECKGAP